MSRVSRCASPSIRFGNVGCLIAVVVLIASLLAGETATRAFAVSTAGTTSRHTVTPAAQGHALSSQNVFEGLRAPDAIASDGTHVWVANYGDNAITELIASTGAL